MLSVLAMALLLGRVAYHRPGHVRRILLITGFVASGRPAVLITVFAVCLFGSLWFA